MSTSALADRWTSAPPCPVRIAADGVVLEAGLGIPPQARGLVIFAHGSGSSHRSPRNQQVAQALRQHGFGTLLCDLLTRCEEATDFDAGLRFDIPLLTGRLMQATRWVAQHPGLRHLPLGYCGASTGAAAALCASVLLGAQIRAIVTRGGRPDLAGAALAQVKAPTLLIVGGWDDVVLQLNYAALDQLHGEKRLEIIPRATHLFAEPGALEKVGEFAHLWFARHLPPTPHPAPP